MKIKTLLTAVFVALVLFTRVDSVFATGTNLLKIQHFLVTAVPSGNFVNDTPWSVNGNPSTVVAADVNGDGHLDLICDDGNSGLTVLLNDGSGTSATPFRWPLATVRTR